jgi:hypothetical protein
MQEEVRRAARKREHARHGSAVVWSLTGPIVSRFGEQVFLVPIVAAPG